MQSEEPTVEDSSMARGSVEAALREESKPSAREVEEEEEVQVCRRWKKLPAGIYILCVFLDLD